LSRFMLHQRCLTDRGGSKNRAGIGNDIGDRSCFARS
jgi:hypothetical protein